MYFGICLEKNVESFFLATAQSPGRGRSQARGAAQEKKFDLLSDLGGDIFAAPSQTSSSTNFANFAHFPSQSGKSYFRTLNTDLYHCLAFGLSSSHALPCHGFYFHIHCMCSFFLVWLQHLRVIQIPTLPTLRHLETLQFHPTWARPPPQSPFHQVPRPSIVFPPPYPHTLALISVF